MTPAGRSIEENMARLRMLIDQDSTFEPKPLQEASQVAIADSAPAVDSDSDSERCKGIGFGEFSPHTWSECSNADTEEEEEEEEPMEVQTRVRNTFIEVISSESSPGSRALKRAQTDSVMEKKDGYMSYMPTPLASNATAVVPSPEAQDATAMANPMALLQAALADGIASLAAEPAPEPPTFGTYSPTLSPRTEYLSREVSEMTSPAPTIGLACDELTQDDSIWQQKLPSEAFPWGSTALPAWGACQVWCYVPDATQVPQDVLDAVQSQVEHYFSDANLLLDRFFSGIIFDEANPEGWLAVDVITNCNRIKQLLCDFSPDCAWRAVGLAARGSALLEVSEDMTSIRRKGARGSPQLPEAADMGMEEGSKLGQEILSMLMENCDAVPAAKPDKTENAGRDLLALVQKEKAKPPVKPLREGPCPGKPFGCRRVTADADEIRTDCEAATSKLLCCQAHLEEACLEARGCRLVQEALACGSNRTRRSIAVWLHGHARKLLMSPHGNFVIQKLIEVLPAADTAFVAEEILPNASSTAKSQYGCRAVCRLIEHCLSVSSTRVLMSALLNNQETLCALCRHQYGHYPIQTILECGSAEDRKKVAAALRVELVGLASHKFASYVVEKALEYCSEQDQDDLIEMLTQRCIIEKLANSRGVYVLKSISKRDQELRQKVRDTILDKRWLDSSEGQDVQKNKHSVAFIEELRSDSAPASKVK